MSDFKTQRFYAVEIPIPARNVSQRFQFPDLPNLTGVNGVPVLINAIEFYTTDALNDVSPISGQSVLPLVNLQSSFLTIYQGDLQVLYNYPCAELVSTAPIVATFGNVGNIEKNKLQNLINVSWTKCFISTPGGAYDPGASAKVYAIGIHYSVFKNMAAFNAYQQEQLF